MAPCSVPAGLRSCGRHLHLERTRRPDRARRCPPPPGGGGPGSATRRTWSRCARGDAWGFTGSVCAALPPGRTRWRRSPPAHPSSSRDPPWRSPIDDPAAGSCSGWRRSAGARQRAHPHRHVRGQRPGVGIVVEDDPGHHVDHEGDDARPQRAVVQQLRPGLQRPDGIPRRGPRPPRRGGREGRGCRREGRSSAVRGRARPGTLPAGSRSPPVAARHAACDCWQGGRHGPDRRRCLRGPGGRRARGHPRRAARRDGERGDHHRRREPAGPALRAVRGDPAHEARHLCRGAAPTGSRSSSPPSAGPPARPTSWPTGSGSPSCTRSATTSASARPRLHELGWA